MVGHRRGADRRLQAMAINAAGVGSHGADALGAGTSRANAAFDADLERLSVELLRYTRTRISDAEVAADVVQDACLRAMRYRGSLGAESLRSMLYRIVNNLLADHWRRASFRNAEGHVPLDPETMVAVEPQPDEELAEEQRMAALKRAIMALPPKRRQVLILARLQGKSHTEIAQICGITVSTVEKHLARAIIACGETVGKLDL